MCGIAGFNYEDKDLIKRMCDLMKHRGPDEFGFYLDSKISLGIMRLSIIDLITGNQPQHNEDQDIWIVFNGEIYNFKELRQILEKSTHKFYTNSDTEVILHAYEEWGEKCVERFRGQFAFCIYDSKKERLFLARDHMGLKPLYYYFNGNKLIFASEIKSILCHNIKRKVNKRAINLLLSLKYVPSELTLFKGIYKLPPASYLIFDLLIKKIKVKKYWNFNFKTIISRTTDELKTELKNLIEESVKVRLLSDVPIGAFLSGGIDSTAIVGFMTKFLDEPVKTFSLYFEEGAPINEQRYSRLVVEYYNTDHTEMVIKSTSYKILPKLVWHLDDLITDAAIIPIYLMAKSARKKMSVALTGDGADEIFAGYSVFYKKRIVQYPKFFPRSPLDSIMKFYNHIPSNKVKFFLSYLNKSKTEEDSYIRNLLTMYNIDKPDIFPYKVDNVEEMIKKTFVKNLDIVNQFTNWDLKYQIPNQYNMKIDKMTMAASLEARTPFLDYKIVKWAASIPPQLKLKKNIEKYILRLAVKDIVPPEILKRKKTAFGTPMNLWLKTGMKEVSSEILDRLTKRSDIIKPSYIKSIKKNRFIKYYQTRVWNLIMLELWYETFIENNDLKPIVL